MAGVGQMLPFATVEGMALLDSVLSQISE